MQPIERVGVFALLFLVVTVIAVVMWDKSPDEPGKTPGKSEVRAATQSPPKAPKTTRGSGPQLGEPASSRPATPKSRGPAGTQLLPTSRQQLLVPPPKKESTRTGNPPRTRTRSDRQESPALASPPGPASPGPGKTVAANTPSKASERVTTPPPAVKAPVETTRSPTRVPKSHVVRSGETLGEISLAYYGTTRHWKDIASLNGVDPTRLTVGRELELPKGVALESRTSTKAPARSESVASEASYRVRSGDSLWVIAKRELGDADRWTEIRDLNPSIDTDRLSVGAMLVLPEGVSARAKTAKAPTTAKVSTPTPARREKKGVVR